MVAGANKHSLIEPRGTPQELQSGGPTRQS